LIIILFFAEPYNFIKYAQDHYFCLRLGNERRKYH